MSFQDDIRHALEDRDVNTMLDQFTEDADYVMIDQTQPPSHPMEAHGREAIGRSLREIFERDMTHEVEQFVVQGDHAAYVERCTYPDGSRVMVMSMLDLRDGRIVRQSSVQAWDEAGTAIQQAVSRDFTEPDEVRTFPRGRLELLRVGGRAIGRMRLEPGWRWSQDVKPIAGTELCMTPHLLHVQSGTLHIQMGEGAEFDIGPDGVSQVPPGHDSWVVGDEEVLVDDWLSPGGYAAPS